MKLIYFDLLKIINKLYLWNKMIWYPNKILSKEYNHLKVNYKIAKHHLKKICKMKVKKEFKVLKSINKNKSNKLWLLKNPKVSNSKEWQTWGQTVKQLNKYPIH